MHLPLFLLFFGIKLLFKCNKFFIYYSYIRFFFIAGSYTQNILTLKSSCDKGMKVYYYIVVLMLMLSPIDIGLMDIYYEFAVR